MKYILIKIKNPINTHIACLRQGEYDVIEISYNYNKLLHILKEQTFNINYNNLKIKFCKAFGFMKDKKCDNSLFVILRSDKLPYNIYQELKNII